MFIQGATFIPDSRVFRVFLLITLMPLLLEVRINIQIQNFVLFLGTRRESVEDEKTEYAEIKPQN